MSFVMQPFAGSALTTTSTTASFAVGTIGMGTDGTKWMFVKASAAITQYDAVGIEQTTFTAAPLTKAFADAGRRIGFAQVAFAADDYGWVNLGEGAFSVRLRNSCQPSVPLYTSAVAGLLDDTSASQTRVYGVRSTDTATASAAAKVCWGQGPVT